MERTWLNFLSLILCILLLYLKDFRFRKNLILWYLANFPVFFFHELAHYLVAFILGACPELPSFTIRKIGNHYIMGSVTCRKVNFFNALPVGLAPLILLVPAWLVVHSSLPLGIKLLFLNYLLPAAIPSKQDLKVISLSSIAFWSLLITSLFVFLSKEPQILIFLKRLF